MKKEKIIEKPTVTKNDPVPEVAEIPEGKAKTRPQRVTKVGAMLKEMRLQKGLKLPDIAKQLCIRKHYLEAVEESDYKEIPAFPYGVGFIRSYAKFLGLNSENIVELYKEETRVPEPQNIHVLEPQPEASMPTTQYIIISVVAVILLYVGWLFLNHTDTPVAEETADIAANTDNSGVIIVEDFNLDQTEKQAESAASSEAENTESAPSVSVESAPVKEPVKEQPAPEVKSTEESETASVKEPIVVPSKGIFIEAVKETWVEVKDDTKLWLSKVLPEGATYKVPDGEGMILSVGKNDGVKVYVNGVLTQVVSPTKKMNIALDPFLGIDQ